MKSNKVIFIWTTFHIGTYCSLSKKLQALALLELFYKLKKTEPEVERKIIQKIIAAIAKLSQNNVLRLY